MNLVSLFDPKKLFLERLPVLEFWRVFSFFFLVGSVLFLRPPHTNFVYDEQEALLANPYLLGDVPVTDFLRVDFWGRFPETTIGSYRPLPNLVWRPFAATLSWNTPWVLCLLNVAVHALTATLLYRLLFTLLVEGVRSRGGENRIAAGFAGLFFLTAALSTEAVSGIVGLSDLLVGLFTVCSLWVLVWVVRKVSLLRVVSGTALVFSLVFLGALSKETMLASLPLLSLFPWALGALLRKKFALGILTSCLATVGASLAVVAYVLLRNHYFSAPGGNISQFVSGGPLRELLLTFFRWFAPPTLPSDPFNNPLLVASAQERIAAGCELFGSQLLQSVFPWHLWGDSSYPRQLSDGWSWGACAGVALMIMGTLFGVVFAFLRRKEEEGSWFIGWGILFLCLSYIPVSNILFALPTIRADRLFYTPTFGVAFVVCGLVRFFGPFLWKWSRTATIRSVAIFFAVQCTQARAHAMHYTSDVSYWYAASRGAPASAKAHLNLGVMLGARGDLDARLKQTRRAVELSPKWPMGQIYLGDVYCRRGELSRAFEYYEQGLSKSAHSKALTALALQCIWESGSFEKYRPRLVELSEEHPDSWLDYLMFQLVHFGASSDGIPSKYRPRKYNQRRAGQAQN